MKTMKRIKIIATLVTFVFTFVLLVPTYTAAARGWWRPPPPPRYHHHHGWSKSDTAALVILGLGLWALSNNSKSDKPYYEKRQDAINDFNDDELAVLRLIERTPTDGNLYYLSYSTNKEKNTIKNVLEELYGEYEYRGVTTYRGRSVVVFRHFSNVYDNNQYIQNANMSNYEVTIYNHIASLSPGEYTLSDHNFDAYYRNVLVKFPSLGSFYTNEYGNLVIVKT